MMAFLIPLGCKIDYLAINLIICKNVQANNLKIITKSNGSYKYSNRCKLQCRNSYQLVFIEIDPINLLVAY